MTINTAAELLQLVVNGRIDVKEDLETTCDVPHAGVGENIHAFDVCGYLIMDGDLDVCGNLVVGGYLIVGGDLDVGGGLIAGHNLAVHNLTVRGDICVGRDLSVRGNLDVRGAVEVGGNLAVRGDWYWSHAAMPLVGGRMTHNRVLPPAWQRDFWDKWLGVDASGCYDDVIARLNIPALLKDPKWSETERWMLKSLLKK